MLSARGLWGELYALLGPKALSDDRFEQTLAYWQSYFLLTAHAFENAYRALLVARGGSWREALSKNGGHGLSQQIAAVTALNEDETNLIARLETYSLWAGKYLVPKQPEVYEKALQKFHLALMGCDDMTAEKLFSRIEAAVRTAVAEHGNKEMSPL